jgi:hypothetical protein
MKLTSGAVAILAAAVCIPGGALALLALAVTAIRNAARFGLLFGLVVALLLVLKALTVDRARNMKGPRTPEALRR